MLNSYSENQTHPNLKPTLKHGGEARLKLQDLGPYQSLDQPWFSVHQSNLESNVKHCLTAEARLKLGHTKGQ